MGKKGKIQVAKKKKGGSGGYTPLDNSFVEPNKKKNDNGNSESESDDDDCANGTTIIAASTGVSTTGLLDASSSSSSSSSKSSDTVVLSGLSNIGNTCFFNTCLQAICCTRFNLGSPRLNIISGSGSSICSNLSTVLSGMVTVERAEEREKTSGDGKGALSSSKTKLTSKRSSTPCFNPERMLTALSKEYVQFKGRNQHDTHEAFIAIISGVKDEFDKKVRMVREGLRSKQVKKETAAVDKDDDKEKNVDDITGKETSTSTAATTTATATVDVMPAQTEESEEKSSSGEGKRDVKTEIIAPPELTIEQKLAAARTLSHEFTGQCLSCVECYRCNLKFYRIEEYFDLSLSIPGSEDLMKIPQAKYSKAKNKKEQRLEELEQNFKYKNTNSNSSSKTKSKLELKLEQSRRDIIAREEKKKEKGKAAAATADSAVADASDTALTNNELQVNERNLEGGIAEVTGGDKLLVNGDEKVDSSEIDRENSVVDAEISVGDVALVEKEGVEEMNITKDEAEAAAEGQGEVPSVDDNKDRCNNGTNESGVAELLLDQSTITNGLTNNSVDSSISGSNSSSLTSSSAPDADAVINSCNSNNTKQNNSNKNNNKYSFPDIETLRKGLKGGAANVDACLTSFVSDESLEVSTGNGFYCNNCKDFCDANKRISPLTLPNILVIHLKRLLAGGKYDSFIEFPATIDMTPFICGVNDCSDSNDIYNNSSINSSSNNNNDSSSSCSSSNGDSISAGGGVSVSNSESSDNSNSNNNNSSSSDLSNPTPTPTTNNSNSSSSSSNNIYNLHSVAVHQGGSKGGHYICYVKYHDHWYYTSDSTVKLVGEKEVLGCAAYMLYYIRHKAA